MAVEIINLIGAGLVPYRVAWERQRELVELRQRGEISDTLLLLEHPPTVTYGKTANAANRLLTDDEYARRGIALIATDRGGDVTYHGPGQLVGYPIIHLGDGNRDLHRYVRTLEEILIAAVAELGVADASRADWHAGVWAGDGYLAAIGVRVSRWVTHHGFALNVTEQVRENYPTIIPCGVPDKRIATLSELTGRGITVSEAAETVARCFQSRFAE